MRTRRVLCKAGRGYTLIEMIAVVILLAVFMVVICDLFAVTYRGQKDSLRRDELIRRVDGAMSALRRDVWSARHLAVADGRLRLERGEAAGEAIIWDCSGGTSLVRREGDAIRSWTNLPEASVNVQGAVVTVTFQGREPESIMFASQVMLAGGER